MPVVLAAFKASSSARTQDRGAFARLVSEAATGRFWEIAPEIALGNGIAFDASSGNTFPLAVTIMSRHLANDILRQAGIKQKV